jgi:UDP-N-acetylmuramate--alanine ligase
MAKIYLVGIGGISMSGIAKYELSRGNQIFGSDIAENSETKTLQSMGATIFLDQKKENVENCLPLDLLIYSSAITPESPGFVEVKVAQTKGIKVIKRSEYFKVLTREFPTIAISGMHGKTTTTAMIGYILKNMGENPLVFVGAETDCFTYSNVEVPEGKPKYLVIEACEYDSSFLDFSYTGAIILNIEKEHLDYFKGGLPEIIKTFNDFANIGGDQGFIVALDESIVRQALSGVNKEIIYFSERELNNEKIELSIIGRHNQLNALAALKVIGRLDLDMDKAREILKEFPGTKRRLELRGKFKEIPVFDDYAHHPTEIKASVDALRSAYPDKNIFLIFQPHQYSRTTLLFDQFVEALTKVDKLCLVEVYGVAGREKVVNPKSSLDLFESLKEKVNEIFYVKDYNEAEQIAVQNADENDLIVVMGAGPIDQLATNLIKKKI